MENKITTIDFETKAIEQRPNYPPEPVGVAIHESEKLPYYLAWAHPSKNNCTWEKAVQTIRRIWDGGQQCLFHYGQFDQDVAETYMRVSPLPWERFHDTLFSLFLADPDSPNLSLKPSAAYWLGVPPIERDELKDWILANVKGATEKNWGAYIAHAPGDLVGHYAIGDVVRTRALHNYLYPKIIEEGMKNAYDRERQIQRILLSSEREGLRVDVPKLGRDLELYEEALARADIWICKRLGRQINVNSGDELTKALRDSGVVSQFAKTPTGKDSKSKKTLTLERYNDLQVFHALGYRNRLSTCLTTFMRKWAELANSNKDRIHTNWSQVRNADERTHGLRGARTGRITSQEPPFTNIPKTWDGRSDNYNHPAWLGVPELPLIRRYVLPDKGQTFLHTDYNQQELRILAHYENGELMQAYNENPHMDIHQYVTDAINRLSNRNLQRKIGKLLDLAMVYGEGQGKLAAQIGCSVEEARQIIAAHRAALPGLAQLQRGIKLLCLRGEPVITWGGRRYFCESPKIVNGRMRNFEYKQLNRLIQPSAADCTKEALIRYMAHPKRRGKFLVTVYDEINVSCEDWQSEACVVKECMESVEFDVPMICDTKFGPNWADLTEVRWE